MKMSLMLTLQFAGIFVLLLTFGPRPSQGLKCHVCGKNAMDEVAAEGHAISDALSHVRNGRQSEDEIVAIVNAEREKFNSALLEDCDGLNGDGKVVDCRLRWLPEVGNQPLVCMTSETGRTGRIGRSCIPEKQAVRLPCLATLDGGPMICFCQTDRCNAGRGRLPARRRPTPFGGNSPSLKPGPLTVMLLVLVLPVLGWLSAFFGI